jgi:ribonucleoside-diphosphate reductase alpha chain
MQLDNLIKRHFTKILDKNKGMTVYDIFNWKTVTVNLTDYKTGKVLFHKDNLEFPDFYSQNACDIIASKYFRMAGINNGYGYERSLKEVVHRMVSFWTEYAYKEGLLNKDNKQIFYDEVAYALISQMWAPNSPQWFNTGLKLVYGISRESDGHFYYDEKKGKVVRSKDSYTRTQGSACFILSIEDKLLGPHSITDQLVTETRLFKHGSGTGSNFSNLRAVGEKLSGGGTSSGLMSFLKVFDSNAGAIKSGGVTRRAAKLISLDCDHPEIFEYINWKAKEEDKVRALGKMGYDTDFNGEAYATVSGQNANNSIRITDELMKKMLGIDPDPKWELKGRIDPRVNRIVDARDIWKAFNEASWKCADPAPQFHDTINVWHTCPAGENGEFGAKENTIQGSNPCSEYHFLNDTACNLASINVMRFYDPETGRFDLESYLHVIALCQIVLETTIYQGQFPTADIARRSYMFRTTGLGIANTGALNMAMAHPYDSNKARAVTAALVGIITGYSYFVSALMAEKVGPFPKYETNRPYMLRVIRNHCRVAGALDDDYEGLGYNPIKVDHGILVREGLARLSETLKDAWKKALEYGVRYGYRNAQVSAIAPTGTISLAMDCATTSVEPFFAHVIYKKLAGGGYMELVNPMIPVALKKLGYTQQQIDDIVEYVMRKEKVKQNGYVFEKIKDGKIEGAPHLKKEHLAIFDTANNCGTGKRHISPMGHVRMVAAVTPLVSGAISKTVNLPNSATVEDFEKVHKAAWLLGVKCIALYRDGSKASQPLNSTDNNRNGLESKTYDQLLAYARELEEKIRMLQQSQGEALEETAAAAEEEEIPEGYHKVVCSNCGSSAVVPNGTCTICVRCGSSSGCS